MDAPVPPVIFLRNCAGCLETSLFGRWTTNKDHREPRSTTDSMGRTQRRIPSHPNLLTTTRNRGEQVRGTVLQTIQCSTESELNNASSSESGLKPADLSESGFHVVRGTAEKSPMSRGGRCIVANCYTVHTVSVSLNSAFGSPYQGSSRPMRSTQRVKTGR